MHLYSSSKVFQYNKSKATSHCPLSLGKAQHNKTKFNIFINIVIFWGQGEQMKKFNCKEKKKNKARPTTKASEECNPMFNPKIIIVGLLVVLTSCEGVPKVIFRYLFMFLLISEGLCSIVIFSFKPNHFVDPPPIVLEHGLLPNNNMEA